MEVEQPLPARRATPAQVRRVFQIVLGSVLLVVLVVASIGALLPKRWSVERSIVIGAPSARVHAIVSDLGNWSAWADPSAQRPGVVTELGPPTSGAGATLRWQTSGAPATQVRILASDPQAGVRFELVAGTTRSQAALRYRQGAGISEVFWQNEGTLMPVIGGLLRDVVQTRVGMHLEASLERLKALAEKAGTAGPPGGP
jgi:hypothetical protein